MSSDNPISVQNLSVRFGKDIILPNINLEIGNSQIVGLIGPSGSGKTTLVKSLIGMNKFEGNIHILEQKIPNLNVFTCIGYMAQSDALYEDLSALNNLLFFANLLNIRGKSALEKANEMLDFVDLSKHRNKLVKNFSGGMKRRLSLAIALIHDPKILILDEPTVGIDPLLRLKFWEKFESLRKNGCTILITTHVMDEAYHCDRLLLLRNGTILADGSLDNLFSTTKKNTVEDVFLYYSNMDLKEQKQ
jgi:ABC-2 type transport system ATP-binding protein